MNVMLRLAALRERLRGALWVYPTAAVVLALAAGFGMSFVDPLPEGRYDRVLFSGNADSARTLIATLLAALVTVTGVVLSITVVALQIASQQFSPRLLRRFLRDRSTQLAISVLLATFGYMTAILQALPAGEVRGPQLAVELGLLLSLLSLAGLVYFIHDITTSIRVESIMASVERETAGAIRHLYPHPVEAAPAGSLPEPQAGMLPLTAPVSGYLQAVDLGHLVAVAVKVGAVLRFVQGIGSHLAEGALLAWVWPAVGDGPVDVARLRRHLDEGLQVGFERTLQHEVTFGLGQLVDMGIKALSPAVNDPRTAVEAVHHLSVLVCLLGDRDLPGLIGRDEAGLVRVVVERPTFAKYLSLACDQIRRFGAAEPTVLIALLRMLGSCATAVSPARRHELDHHVALVLEAAEQHVGQSADLDEVRAAAEVARQRINLLCAVPVGAS